MTYNDAMGFCRTICVIFVCLLAFVFSGQADTASAETTGASNGVTSVPVAVATPVPEDGAAYELTPAEADPRGDSLELFDDDSFSDFSSLDLEALLNTEVDTGGSFKQKLSEVPAVVEVISRAEIAAMGLRDLNEIIQHFTGTYERTGTYTPIVENSNQIRGGGISDRFLIMVDDHGQLGELDEVYNPFSIPVDSIERVEFLRGPAAVLYGSSSMGGVVRVITRDPEASGASATLIGDPLGRGAGFSAGGSLVRNVADDPLRVAVDVQGRMSAERGLDVPADVFNIAGVHEQQVTYVTALVTARWKGLYARAQYHQIQSKMFGLLPTFALKTSNSTLQLFGAEFGYRTEIDRLLVEASVASDLRLRDLDWGQFPPYDLAGRSGEQNRTNMEFDGMVNEGKLKATWMEKNWHLMTGLQTRVLSAFTFTMKYANDDVTHTLSPDLLDANKDLSATVLDLNWFAQGDYKLFESLSLLGGGRINYYQPKVNNLAVLAPEEASPAGIWSPMGRAALVWSPHKVISVKALYGRAFRLPTMLEMFTVIKKVVLPAPDLGPELEDTYEVSLNVRPVESLSIQLNGFYYNVLDSIEFEATSANVGQFRNQDEPYWVYGAETDIRWIPTRWVSTFAKFTFNEGYRRDPVSKRQTYMSSLPRVLAKGGATFSPLGNEGLTITPYVWYQGHAYKRGGDTVWDLSARWQAASWLALHASGFNLFDKAYYQPIYLGLKVDPMQTKMTGTRSLRLGATATF